MTTIMNATANGTSSSARDQDEPAHAGSQLRARPLRCHPRARPPRLTRWVPERDQRDGGPTDDPEDDERLASPSCRPRRAARRPDEHDEGRGQEHVHRHEGSPERRGHRSRVSRALRQLLRRPGRRARRPATRSRPLCARTARARTRSSRARSRRRGPEPAHAHVHEPDDNRRSDVRPEPVDREVGAIHSARRNLTFSAKYASPSVNTMKGSVRIARIDLTCSRASARGRRGATAPHRSIVTLPKSQSTTMSARTLTPQRTAGRTTQYTRASYSAAWVGAMSKLAPCRAARRGAPVETFARVGASRNRPARVEELLELHGGAHVALDLELPRHVRRRRVLLAGHDLLEAPPRSP